MERHQDKTQRPDGPATEMVMTIEEAIRRLKDLQGWRAHTIGRGLLSSRQAPADCQEIGRAHV